MNTTPFVAHPFVHWVSNGSFCKKKNDDVDEENEGKLNTFSCHHHHLTIWSNDQTLIEHVIENVTEPNAWENLTLLNNPKQEDRMTKIIETCTGLMHMGPI